MELTDTKYNKFIEALDICKEDLNYYKVICLKEVPPDFSFPRDSQIHLYKYQNDHIFKRSKRIEVIYEKGGRYYQVILIKLRLYLTKRILDKLSQYEDEMVHKMYIKGKLEIKWEKYDYTYIYINVDIKELPHIEGIKKIPLTERIDPDICFNVYNQKEIEEIWGKRDLELLKLDFKYKILDVENLLDQRHKRFNFKIDSGSNYSLN